MVATPIRVGSSLLLGDIVSAFDDHYFESHYREIAYIATGSDTGCYEGRYKTLDIQRERYANGEIGSKEFEERQRTIAS